jgi:capsular polysaccharide biosynthesis protein
VTDPATNSLLPLVDVMSLAHTPAEAARVSQVATDVFRSYITNQQASAGIPLNERVQLEVVSTKTTLAKGRKKTLAIVSFLAVIIATVGLAFVLENLRPRVRAAAPAEPASLAAMRREAEVKVRG